jgi:hypothetical protein
MSKVMVRTCQFSEIRNVGVVLPIGTEYGAEQIGRGVDFDDFLDTEEKRDLSGEETDVEPSKPVEVSILNM